MVRERLRREVRERKEREELERGRGEGEEKSKEVERERREERVESKIGRREKEREEKVRQEKRGKRYIRLAWVMIFAACILLLHKPKEEKSLQISVLDIGQGDCIFLRGERGGTYLIDGGSTDVKQVGKYRILPFLKYRGISRLDYVLISHGDADHSNGVEEILQDERGGVKIGKLVLPPKEYWEERLERLAQMAQEAGVEVYTIGQGEEIREGKLQITCLFPQEARKGEEVSKGNEASMVLEVSYGAFDMLLTGDLEREGEKKFVEDTRERYRKKKVEVLKVAHHGSRHSTSDEFLDSIQPDYAIISSGFQNRYGHPHKEVLKRLKKEGSRILQTQEGGEVFITVRGETMEIGSLWQSLK